ncbi:MAG: 5'-methylthioadenosine/adenosylhomocysteine nucleosidase [Clostridiales bacterium]|nr:5'-methylthioadenosine/adenosylhomocysteine nucleosidase [Clostridiales bacterium]
MKWGILGALDAEVDLIRREMTVSRETPLFGTTYYEGTVHGQDIILVCCGVGKVNAAICAAAAVERFGADCIVNVGIAGAMGHGLNILDVVISREVGFHDQDAVMLNYYPKRAFFPADERLAALCERACAAIPEMEGRYRLGRIVSGDVFVNDAAVKQSIRDRYEPDCVEMEGAAIGHAAFMYEKPYLVIRTMSDAADDNADETYDDFIGEAARTSATIILKMLDLAAE